MPWPRAAHLTVLLVGPPPAAARLAGFHVDDESCSGLLQHGRAQQEAVCAKFFASLSAQRETLAAGSAGLAAPLRLAVDAGTAWVCPPGTEGCFNLTYNGSTKSVAGHVVDLADETVLMDYDRSPDNAYARARPYLDYADSVGKDRSVVVGVAVASWGTPNPDGWRTRNESELEALMAAAQPALARHRSFRGFAVFTDGDWWSASRGAPAAPAAGVRAATWYVNHTAVLTAAARDAWLEWAASRAIKEVYLAPHAGSRALISIPGIEGSKEDDAKFCDFVHLADAQGLDVQLIADPTPNDLAFVQNCSARPPPAR